MGGEAISNAKLIIILIAFFAFYPLLVMYLSIKFLINESYCSEICFPYNYDMLDAETCVCWLPNGKLEKRPLK